MFDAYHHRELFPMNCVDSDFPALVDFMILFREA